MKSPSLYPEPGGGSNLSGRRQLNWNREEQFRRTSLNLKSPVRIDRGLVEENSQKQAWCRGYEEQQSHIWGLKNSTPDSPQVDKKTRPPEVACRLEIVCERKPNSQGGERQKTPIKEPGPNLAVRSQGMAVRYHYPLDDEECQ